MQTVLDTLSTTHLVSQFRKKREAGVEVYKVRKHILESKHPQIATRGSRRKRSAGHPNHLSVLITVHCVVGLTKACIAEEVRLT